MARFANIEVPNNKRVVISLTAIFGIGKSTAQKILQECGIDENIRTKDLTTEQENAIRKALEKYKLEGELKRDIALDIKRLMEIKSYRGIRHRKGLPVRGQVTQKNARTRKGKRKTVANKAVNKKK